MDLIEPEDDPTPESLIWELLLSKGLPPHEVTRLVELFTNRTSPRWWPNGRLSAGLPESARIDGFVDHARIAYRDDAPLPDARFNLLHRLAKFGVVVGADDIVIGQPTRLGVTYQSPVVRVLLPTLLAWGLDLRRSLATPDVPDWLRDALFGDLDAEGALRPRDFLDLRAMREWNRFATRGGADSAIDTPRSPDFWFRVRGPRVLDDFRLVVEAESPDSAGCVASSVLQAYAHPFTWATESPVEPRDATTGRIVRWCEHLAMRVDAAMDDRHVLAAYLKAVELLGSHAGDPLPEPHRATAARIAGRALGKLRAAARVAGQEARSCDHVATIEDHVVYSSAVGIVARSAGLGEALVAGALLLRAIPEAAVSSDLRWRDEPSMEPVPPRWAWLMSSLVAVTHSLGAIEERVEPELRQARGRFCQFLLERLKPGKSVDGVPTLTEPDSAWRRCCIRALRELAINPDGRAHQILYHVERSDPDSEVQEAARLAYEELRRCEGSSGDVSPRRRVLAALWWLRQAHRIGLNLPIDATGARRTRQREISFTQETTQQPH